MSAVNHWSYPAPSGTQQAQINFLEVSRCSRFASAKSQMEWGDASEMLEGEYASPSRPISVGSRVAGLERHCTLLLFLITLGFSTSTYYCSSLQGPTGKSSFIETEKVSFVERFHGENNKLNIYRLFRLLRSPARADQLEDFPTSYFNGIFLHSF